MSSCARDVHHIRVARELAGRLLGVQDEGPRFKPFPDFRLGVTDRCNSECHNLIRRVSEDWYVLRATL